jgi:hypothetical protein
MLALWHAIHIPLGMVLFSAAIIHIVAAVYYATMLSPSPFPLKGEGKNGAVQKEGQPPSRKGENVIQ